MVGTREIVWLGSLQAEWIAGTIKIGKQRGVQKRPEIKGKLEKGELVNKSATCTKLKLEEEWWLKLELGGQVRESLIILLLALD